MEPIRKIEKVSLRNLHMEDYDQLAKSFKRIYADSGHASKSRNSLLYFLKVRLSSSWMIRL